MPLVNFESSGLKVKAEKNFKYFERLKFLSALLFLEQQFDGELEFASFGRSLINAPDV